MIKKEREKTDITDKSVKFFRGYHLQEFMRGGVIIYWRKRKRRRKKKRKGRVRDGKKEERQK